MPIKTPKKAIICCKPIRGFSAELMLTFFFALVQLDGSHTIPNVFNIKTWTSCPLGDSAKKIKFIIGDL
jgi:hypothetical protein